MALIIQEFQASSELDFTSFSKELKKAKATDIMFGKPNGSKKAYFTYMIGDKKCIVGCGKTVEDNSNFKNLVVNEEGIVCDPANFRSATELESVTL